MDTRIAIDCDTCSASYVVEHSMDDGRYVVEGCSFCGSQDIHTDEDGLLNGEDEEHRVA